VARPAIVLTPAGYFGLLFTRLRSLSGIGGSGE
jgi:hypothetical protein